MRHNLIAAACVCGFAGSVAAQVPTQPQPTPPVIPTYPLPVYPGAAPAVMPNIYNPRTQPLSPYLNLLRGGNAGVNYYYGVRPGTVGGAGSFGAASALAPGGGRTTGFPLVATDPDAVDFPEPGKGYVVPPAGHPVVFGNTMGYFPGPMSGTGFRPGLAGNRPTAGRPGPRR